MRFLFYIFILFSIGASVLRAQDWSWSNSVTSHGYYYNNLLGLTTDQQKNLIYFDPGKRDLVKMTSKGQKIWRKKINTSKYQWAILGIVVADDASLYLSGYFWDTAVVAGQNYVSRGWGDSFICKTDASGNVQWFKTIGGSGGEFLGGVCMQGKNVIFAGKMFETIFIGDEVFYHLRPDMFLGRLTPSGELDTIIFPQFSSTTGFDDSAPGEMQCDAAGNIYVLGGATGTFSIGGMAVNGGSGSTLVMKFDQDFNGLWYGRDTLVPWDQFVCNLNITSRGEPIYRLQGNSAPIFQNFSHQNFGNAEIRKFSANGGPMQVIYHFPNDFSNRCCIRAMMLDSCDRIYFSGAYYRAGYINNPFTVLHNTYMMNGCMSAAGNMLWNKEETVASSEAWDAVLLAPGKMFVSGHNTKPIELADTLNGSYFFAHITSSITEGCFEVLTVSVDETRGEEKMRIFPNPAHERVLFISPVKMNVYCYNLQGLRVFSQSLEVGENSIPVHLLSKGIYLIRSEDGRFKEKLIVN